MNNRLHEWLRPCGTKLEISISSGCFWTWHHWTRYALLPEILQSESYHPYVQSSVMQVFRLYQGRHIREMALRRLLASTVWGIFCWSICCCATWLLRHGSCL